MITDRTGEFSFLQLGMSDDSIRKTLGVVLQGMMLAVPAVLALAFLGGFFLTRRILAPLRRRGGAAEAMSAGDLRRELPVSGTGDELDRLAGTFNAIFKRLNEAHDRILRFTADASHELRLPLAAIRGEAEVILSRERSIEEYREALGRILEEFERLSRLIEHLLELTRSDSGAETVIRENVHLGRLLEDLVEFYRPLAGEKGIRLFSKGDTDAEMPGDPARLKQLFSNLLDNAVKFTSSGGEVKVELEDRDREIEVRISDTGIGIAREEHHRIFERFYRADRSRARAGGGTGLGLSIAETIAKAHGGRIAVESSPGRGSTFTVTFSMI
jgi:heavy metal sensor kinase